MFEEGVEILFKAFEGKREYYAIPPEVPYCGYILKEITVVPAPERYVSVPQKTDHPPFQIKLLFSATIRHSPALPHTAAVAPARIWSSSELCAIA